MTSWLSFSKLDTENSRKTKRFWKFTKPIVMMRMPKRSEITYRRNAAISMSNKSG